MAWILGCKRNKLPPLWLGKGVARWWPRACRHTSRDLSARGFGAGHQDGRTWLFERASVCITAPANGLGVNVLEGANTCAWYPCTASRISSICQRPSACSISYNLPRWLLLYRRCNKCPLVCVHYSVVGNLSQENSWDAAICSLQELVFISLHLASL